MRPLRFHPLTVTRRAELTDDSVALTLAVPPHLAETFRHLPGQHLTVRHGTARRTYSIASPPGAPELTIGVRHIPGGLFSHHVLAAIGPGHTLHVLPPTGRFTLVPRPGHFAAITGGSGITPVLAMATTLLESEPSARFTLLRAERDAASAMFLDEVADLKDRHPERFQLLHALSREERHTGPATGRLTEPRLRRLLPALLPVDRVDGWYLCGPLGLVDAATTALRTLGVPQGLIHTELFHVKPAPAPPPSETPHAATLTATLDGRRASWPLAPGDTLLTTVLRNRPDAPYACRGGVCGTCRAKLVSGEVAMDRNFALEPAELAAGYVLACQSRPRTPAVELDFDA
ncbi:2Fe-2S iron-sulfur cluster-binding protein [Streptomyces millisiae]|uniref:2Fe-2S iron-sulfur cluster-binding protein n=1 Tax=Streptomyces millisiae TaxID=3075542 RepID=A0ABU2LRF6_9ACTN|nr:2Fe-2S iron-sulfur cluster-binding protein [Streptomyces sp. DSM 44918]MDT0320181.1 2Fe-2S iron-sulfur cluster-binding protein [Streptomyces sp. DSM 44918]